MKAEDPPARDLLAEAQKLAGVNPQYALLVRVARDRLKRFASRKDRVDALADFAVRVIDMELNSTGHFVSDMLIKATSIDSRAARTQRVKVELTIDIAGETTVERSI